MAQQQKKQTVTRKRRELKKVDRGQVHIQSSFNNTLVTVTDMQGNAISWSSAGSLGFKGSRRVLPSLHSRQPKRLLKPQRTTV